MSNEILDKNARFRGILSFNYSFIDRIFAAIIVKRKKMITIDGKNINLKAKETVVSEANLAEYAFLLGKDLYAFIPASITKQTTGKKFKILKDIMPSSTVKVLWNNIIDDLQKVLNIRNDVEHSYMTDININSFKGVRTYRDGRVKEIEIDMDDTMRLVFKVVDDLKIILEEM